MQDETVASTTSGYPMLVVLPVTVLTGIAGAAVLISHSVTGAWPELLPAHGSHVMPTGGAFISGPPPLKRASVAFREGSVVFL